MATRAKCLECSKNQQRITELVAAYICQSPPYCRLACAAHRGVYASFCSLVAEKGEKQFDTMVRIAADQSLSQRLLEMGQRLDKRFVAENSRAFGSETLVMYRAVTSPASFLGSKTRDRSFRFIIKAGIRYPNEFFGDEEAASLLTQMIKYRISVSVLQEAFERWPQPRDKQKVLQSLVKNGYSPFEKRLVLELLFPHYVELSMNKNQNESMDIIKRIQDKAVRALMLSYVQYLMRLYVLKAFELESITRRLPRNLRRHIVETFFSIE